MKKKLAFAFILLFSALLLSNCRKKLQPPSWDADVLTPIFTSTVSIGDLIKDSLVKGSNNKLKLAFHDTVFQLRLDTLFQIPDTVIGDTFAIPEAVVNDSIELPSGTILIDRDEQTQYTIGQAEIKKVILSSGSAEIKLSSTIRGKTVLEYTLPYATKNSVPFSVKEVLPAGSVASPSGVTATYDLSGYTLDLTAGNNSYNTMVTNFVAYIDSSEQPTTVYKTDTFKVENHLINIVPEYVQGYFGRDTITTTSTEDSIKLFKNITGGSIDVEEIETVFTIYNGIGADLQTDIHAIEAFNSEKGNSVMLNAAPFNTSINLTRALDQYPAPLYTEKTIAINTGNSDLDEVLEAFPDRFDYDMTFSLNPLGNISNSNDFLYIDHGAGIILDAEIPLSFAADNITFSDTSELNFDEESIGIPIPSDATLYLYADNGYPFDATLQLYLMDESKSVIDSLIDTEAATITAGVLGQSNISTTKTLSRLAIPLDFFKVYNMGQAAYIKAKVSLTTIPEGEFIQLYDHYEMDLKLVGDFTLNVNIPETGE